MIASRHCVISSSRGRKKVHAMLSINCFFFQQVKQLYLTFMSCFLIFKIGKKAEITK